MITSFDLGNFKAFAEAQNIPLKPITLVFGANSAGKSSIIHSMALAHEAMRTGELDLFRTDIGGSSIDLGGFRQYIHRRQANRRMEWGLALDTKKLNGRLKELLEPVDSVSIHITVGMPLDDQEQPIAGSVPYVMSYEIEDFNNTILRMSRRPNNELAIDLLPYKHPVWNRVISALLEIYTTTREISEKDLLAMEEPISEIVSGLRASIGAFFPKKFKKRNRDDETDTKQLSLFPVSKGYRQEDLAKALHTYLPRVIDELVQELNGVVRTEINRIQYLGPLRSYPPRHFAFSEQGDTNWYAGGGYAWDVVRRNKEVREKVNYWLNDEKKLSTPYELSIKNLLAIDDIEPDYQELISMFEEATVNDDWSGIEEKLGQELTNDLFGELSVLLSRLKENETSISSIQELILVDRRTDTQISHRDVGIGISQVLPVLVSAYASKNKIIAIEQPEIHLHPALQAELGDVFIESALSDSGNTFLLETHSEHLILRILRRIRETAENELEDGMIPIRPDQVAVLYVQPDAKGSKIISIPVNEEGEFERSWPQGFFSERARELF